MSRKRPTRRRLLSQQPVFSVAQQPHIRLQTPYRFLLSITRFPFLRTITLAGFGGWQNLTGLIPVRCLGRSACTNSSSEVASSCLTAQKICAATRIKEQFLALGNVFDIDLTTPIDLGKNAVLTLVRALMRRVKLEYVPCRGKQLQTVPQADSDTMFGNFIECGIGDGNAFRRRPNAHDSLDLFGLIGRGRNDEQAS